MSTSSQNTIANNRTDQVVALQKMIAGFQKHQATLVAMTVAGTSYKVADIIAMLQTRADAAVAAETTRATWLNAVKNDHDERARTKVFVSGLRQALLVAFVGSVDSLADFGLVGRKPPTVSPETRVLAAQKAKATRAARHTMGKNQKAQIKGAVPAAPPVTSSAPSASPVAAPAPVAAHAPSPAPAGSAALATEPAPAAK